jgi:hypothetical protein
LALAAFAVVKIPRFLLAAALLQQHLQRLYSFFTPPLGFLSGF